MQVIPVLDLCQGQAVHARGGLRAHYAPLVSQLAPTAVPGDAVAMAGAYDRVLGARSIYVADLDAIGGAEPQWRLLPELSRAGMGLWVDAGISSAKAAAAWVEATGVERLIVGLETLPGREALEEIIATAGDTRVAFSLDLRDGELMARAAALRHRRAEDVAVMAAVAGAACIIVLDLRRVGSGAGVDERLVGRIAREIPGTELVVGGGVRGAEDLRRLSSLGAHGALVASALHSGQIGRREIDDMAGM